MTHVTCRLAAKNWDQLRNPMLSSRVWATFTFYHYNLIYCCHMQHSMYFKYLFPLVVYQLLTDLDTSDFQNAVYSFAFIILLLH